LPDVVCELLAELWVVDAVVEERGEVLEEAIAIDLVVSRPREQAPEHRGRVRLVVHDAQPSGAPAPLTVSM